MSWVLLDDVSAGGQRSSNRPGLSEAVNAADITGWTWDRRIGQSRRCNDFNVAAQLLAVEAGVDDHQPAARVHLDDGEWLTFRAGRISTDIAVSIERASPAERLDLCPNDPPGSPLARASCSTC